MQPHLEKPATERSGIAHKSDRESAKPEQHRRTSGLVPEPIQPTVERHPAGGVFVYMDLYHDLNVTYRLHLVADDNCWIRADLPVHDRLLRR